MAGTEIALQGIEDFRPAGLQASAGQFQHRVGWLAGDDRFDHGTGRLTMEVAHHDTETNTGVSQYLVQPVLLGGQLADQFLPLAGDQAQLTQFGRRHKRAAQQTRACQRRQPVSITHVRLAARDILDVPRIHQVRHDAVLLELHARTL